VASGAWWDPYIVCGVDNRQLEGDQEFFGLRLVSLRRRADLPDRCPLLWAHDNALGRPTQHDSQQFLMRGRKSPPGKL
ncbi:MAG: hypothetical protein ABI994_09355, partial [Gemmatimonadales bacterium]